VSYIETTAPQEATGAVAELYRRQQGQSSYLPNYARVYCHRPEAMTALAALQNVLKQDMAPRLWALVALAAAREINSSYCSLAFARRLLKDHFSPQELVAVITSAPDAPLQHAERAAMALAAKVARNAATVTEDDIDALRQAGFSDAGIFDVVAAAAWRCFFAKVPDGLGVRPDAALGNLDPFLLQHLVVGRAIDAEQDTQGQQRSHAPR